LLPLLRCHAKATTATALTPLLLPPRFLPPLWAGRHQQRVGYLLLLLGHGLLVLGWLWFVGMFICSKSGFLFLAGDNFFQES
jgi:hypothetical protein